MLEAEARIISNGITINKQHKNIIPGERSSHKDFHVPNFPAVPGDVFAWQQRTGTLD